jgi:hypothetical protein
MIFTLIGRAGNWSKVKVNKFAKRRLTQPHFIQVGDDLTNSFKLITGGRFR